MTPGSHAVLPLEAQQLCRPHCSWNGLPKPNPQD